MHCWKNRFTCRSADIEYYDNMRLCTLSVVLTKIILKTINHSVLKTKSKFVYLKKSETSTQICDNITSNLWYLISKGALSDSG
jgi:hypothetical protein